MGRARSTSSRSAPTSARRSSSTRPGPRRWHSTAASERAALLHRLWWLPKRPKTSGDGTGADRLTITDSRTGSGFELPVEDGAIRAAELRRAEASPGDGGLLSYDPALSNTAAFRSAITFVDGERGALRHRG